MLSVHLTRYSKTVANMNVDTRTITLDNKKQQTHEGPQQKKGKGEFTAEEEVIMIPLEDVILISSKAEVKQGIQSESKSQIIPQYALSENCCDSCCDSILSCCRQKTMKIDPLVRTDIISYVDPNLSTNILEEKLPIPVEDEGCCNKCRCWCCRKKKLVELIRRTNTVVEQEAERVITITIEYSKYSNPDTPSNARLLSNEHQAYYYKEKFQPNTILKFYLINNTEFDKKNFDSRRQEAEVLCRTVMQLKGMKNDYPSENDLEKILDQSHKRTFGLIFQEPTLQIPFNSTTTDSRTQGILPASQRLTIEPRRVSISEKNRQQNN
jgi:hypothetical protein